MPYCNSSSSATIKIFGANQLVEAFQAAGGIDVTAGNYTDIFYGSAWIPTLGNTTFSDLDLSGTITEVGPRVNLGGRSRTTLSNGWTPHFNGDNSVSITFRYFCAVFVRKSGALLFRKEVPCPARFEVACEGECPEGYLKCISNQYPGYCCISCGQVKAEIQGARQALRRI